MKPTKRLVSNLSYSFILLLAGVLRFYRLAGQSLWSDEGNSLALAQASFAQIAARTAFDIHPPFYYWLLKIWLSLFGVSEFSARSLSAVLGIVLVGVIIILGRRFFSPAVGLSAGLVAALSPFQVYYAQEARMYILLALLGAVSVWLAGLVWTEDGRRKTIAIAGYIVAVTLGLYTHYAFPVIWGAINLAALVALWPRKADLWRWIGWQFIPLILYLPWIPTALRQITTWPTLTESATPGHILLTIAQILSLGPSAPAVNNLWLISFGFIFCFGLIKIFRQYFSSVYRPSSFVLLFWLSLPLILSLFLFRPAYLKFLLVASPPYSLLLGLGIITFTPANKLLRYSLWGGLTALIAIPSLLSLNAYYHQPAYARDNYRGIATFVEAIATPNDAIILHAPGQQEVFGFYYQPGPGKATIYPLPTERPLNREATINQLQDITAEAERIYAIYWATEEADPDGLIESWLTQNTFKASDVWFGNVRLVSYATPAKTMAFTPVSFGLGENISLNGYSLPDETIKAGEILRLGLRWETEQTITEDYTVFVQALDANNDLVGQRDAPPLMPASSWPAGEVINDQHGLVIEPGTPPGPHQLIVGLYKSANGERLKLENGQDFISLGQITIVANTPPLPREAFKISQPLSGETLIGYDLYKLGHALSPQTPLRPGEPLHLNLYWQKTDAFPQAETVNLRLLNEQGQEFFVWEMPIAGVNYPPSTWQASEIVRGQFNLFLPAVPPGNYTLEILLADKLMGLTEMFMVTE